MAKKKQKRKNEATHELIDGEVRKVDLVDRPATGDLWLAARSKDAALEIIKQGDWAMGRTAIAADEVARNFETDGGNDQPLTVALDTEDDQAQVVDDQQPESEVVERIGEPVETETDQLTRDDVRDVINEVVPGVVAQTLRALGLVPDATSTEAEPTPEPEPEAAQTPSEPAPEPVERAGAKMSSKRLKRFSSALASIQQGIVTLGDIHRELGGGGDKKKGGVKRDDAFDADFLTNLMSTLATEQSAQMEAAIKREVGKVNERVDKIQASNVKPSSVPTDKTDGPRTKSVKRNDGDPQWSGIVRGTVIQY
jgi:hypothetical protein